MPTKNSVSVSDSCVESALSPKAGRICSNAGSSVSMAIAAMALESAMSRMNSRSLKRPRGRVVSAGAPEDGGVELRLEPARL